MGEKDKQQVARAPLCLRPATEQDLPAMLAIYRPYVLRTTVSFETEPPSLEAFSARFEQRRGVFPWLACEREGQVVGYAYAGRLGQRAGYDWSAEGSVYVAETARGAGVGKALYRGLIALLAAQGYRTLYALVAVPGPESEGFHQAMGFVREGLLRQAGYKFGGFVGVAYYALPLAGQGPPHIAADGAVGGVLQPGDELGSASAPKSGGSRRRRTEDPLDPPKPLADLPPGTISALLEQAAKPCIKPDGEPSAT